MTSMHPHTVDWLRNVEITADSVLAQRRWDAAESFAATLDRAAAIDILRLFLFGNCGEGVAARFTEQLLRLDPDFPVSGNGELLRAMAGFVLAADLRRVSNTATALALGARAARAAGTRGTPAINEIAVDVNRYLLESSSRQRPDSFEPASEQSIEKLGSEYAALIEVQAGGDATQIAKARTAYHTALVDSVSTPRLVNQLAEETQLLWWVVGQFSSTLNKPTATLTSTAYAFISASEVADRIRILPPPPAVDALVVRSLASCKQARKTLTLSDFLAATDNSWRKQQVSRTNNADCRDLVPMCTSLEKMQELGDAQHAVQAAARLCPEIDVAAARSATDVATQYLCELNFLAALASC